MGIDGVTTYRDRGDCRKSSLGIRNYKFGLRQAMFLLYVQAKTLSKPLNVSFRNLRKRAR